MTTSLPGTLPNQGGSDMFVVMLKSSNGSQVFIANVGYAGNDIIKSVASSPDG